MESDIEPPLKRPRLSIFNECQSIDDEDLDSARLANDMALKSRFEAIFEKYSKDFTGVGDEVDIITGEIVVNRGHIERMATETDPGRIRYESGINGRSILEAMAAEEEEDDRFPRPDDVLQSIETIAENVGLMDNSSVDGSADSLFDNSEMSSISPIPEDDTQPLPGNHLEPYNSDTDSLFAVEDIHRSPSVDSLFEDPQEYNESTEPGHFTQVHSSSETPVYDDEGILAKFGKNVGKQVLEILDQRQDLHIEPAWKIPVRLEPQQFHQPVMNMVESIPPAVSPVRKRHQSLWRTAPPRTNTSVRQESEDPLQEGFTEDMDYDGEEDYQPDKFEDLLNNDQRQIFDHAAKTGTCPYCHGEYSTKSGIMAHWDRLIRRSKTNKLGKDDIHDLELIEKSRSKVVRRSRLPRLTVSDFRTMVEFHEGAGYSFEQIAKEKMLRTRKTGPRLQDVYDKHRTVPEVRRSPEPTKEWTADELTSLMEMSSNPLSTMATLQRALGTRSELEVGDKLAEIWLAQLKAAKTYGTNIPLRGTETGPSQIENTSILDNGIIMTIKEESDDELFG